MGHTSGALRSRNSASSAPGPASGRKKRLDGGLRVVPAEVELGKRQPNVPGCLGWSPAPVPCLTGVKKNCKNPLQC